MGLFSRKKEKPEETHDRLNLMTNLAQNKVMKRATSAIAASYKQGRLVFKDNNEAEYTEKGGLKQVYTLNLNELAGMFWEKMNNEIAGLSVGGVQTNLATLDISVQDILEIILVLKEGKKLEVE